MRSREHYISDHMMKSYSAAFHTMRHRRHSVKLTTVHAELTNPHPNLGIDSEGLSTTGQRWSLTLSPILVDVRLVRSMVTSYIKHQAIFIKCLLNGHSRYREWTYQSTNIQRTSIYPSYNRLLLKMGGSYFLKEVKLSNMIKFIKHHVLYHFSIPRQIVHDNGP